MVQLLLNVSLQILTDLLSEIKRGKCYQKICIIYKKKKNFSTCEDLESVMVFNATFNNISVTLYIG